MGVKESQGKLLNIIVTLMATGLMVLSPWIASLLILHVQLEFTVGYGIAVMTFIIGLVLCYYSISRFRTKEQRSL